MPACAADAEAGRDPDSIRVAPATGVCVAETAEQASEKLAYLDSLAKPIDGLTLLCEVLNVDFATRDYDAPFSDEELAEVSWQSLRDRVIAKSGKKNPSVRDFVEMSGRGRLREAPVFTGTPAQVADELEVWFDTACDGFVLAAASLPGSYEDFVRLVVPEPCGSGAPFRPLVTPVPADSDGRRAERGASVPRPGNRSRARLRPQPPPRHPRAEPGGCGPVRRFWRACTTRAQYTSSDIPLSPPIAACFAIGRFSRAGRSRFLPRPEPRRPTRRRSIV